MSKPQLVVMAAGIGSRYGGMKQIDPVGPAGEIVLDYAVYDALRAGFGRIVFVIRRETEGVFRAKVGDSIDRHTEVVYAYQEFDKLPAGFAVPEGRAKPWGTAHAVLCAQGAVDAPFAVINADDFYGRGSFQTLHDYLRGATDRDGCYDYCMIGFRLENTLTENGHVSRGVCAADRDGNLTEVVERTRIQKYGDQPRYAVNDTEWVYIAGDSIVSMNMWGYTPSFMRELEERFPHFLRERIADPKSEFFVPSVVNDLIREGRARVKVLPTQDRWFGVTYKEDRQVVVDAIADLVARGEYPERLWQQ